VLLRRPGELREHSQHLLATHFRDSQKDNRFVRVRNSVEEIDALSGVGPTSRTPYVPGHTACLYLFVAGELIARWADERSFQVLFNGDTSRVIVSSNAPLHLTGDALLAFLLPIAMATWSRLIIEDEVDERLMRSQTRIQEILFFWQPLKLKRVDINAPIVRREPRPNVSSFFSGGVDSTYSALQNRDEITRLVLVHGFDTRVEQVALRADISDRLSRAADTLGIPLVEISTTVRDFVRSLLRMGYLPRGGLGRSCSHAR
jgi:hypothetical protein